MLDKKLNPDIAQLIASRRDGYSLSAEFYTAAAVYQADVVSVWRRGWVFAGHACEVTEPGDYFTLAIDTDSLIVIRGDDGQLRALHNVCRHRGTLICSDDVGTAGRLVCPYHQWVYARDGRLVSCRGMHEVDRSELNLRPAAAREIGGLIFICLAQQPPDFEPAAAQFGPALVPQGLQRAKVAHQIDYHVEANWKLVWENNRECYHCDANHPAYVRANFDRYNEDDTTERIRQRIAKVVAESEAEWAACNLAVTHKQTGMTIFPDPERGIWYSANRTPLVEGYLSESLDGRQVAPLMGDYSAPHVGTLRIRTLPNFWNHSSCDHSVSTRLLPAGVAGTRVRVTWLVDREAVEGRDYQLDRLLPFWQSTSEEDWELCRRAQLGISSPAYVPGPYSRDKEYNVDAFVRWYLGQLGGGGCDPG